MQEMGYLTSQMIVYTEVIYIDARFLIMVVLYEVREEGVFFKVGRQVNVTKGVGSSTSQGSLGRR